VATIGLPGIGSEVLEVRNSKWVAGRVFLTDPTHVAHGDLAIKIRIFSRQFARSTCVSNQGQ
jgi:hypothetical protein